MCAILSGKITTMKLRYNGKIKDGRLRIFRRATLLKDLEAFDGTNVVITIEKRRKARSTEQNRYLWGVVYECALQGFKDIDPTGTAGLTVEDVHEFFKDRFLHNGRDVVTAQGEVLTMKSTTTELSTTDMMVYIEEIIRFCAEYLNTAVPEPNTQATMF